MKELIVICGPTASGKSALAVELSRRILGAVVSCDSMQLYRSMDIGTAKPTSGEMAGVQHHMVDVLDPSEACSAAAYREMAKPIIDGLFECGIRPVLCGGTGLYIDALTKPLGFSIQGDPEVRAGLERIAAGPNGKAALHGMLSGIDPESADRLHENDVRRVIRAIEVHRLTGLTLTEQMKLDAGRASDYPAKLFALDWPRDVLYARIDRRVDLMIAQGLVREVQALLDHGLPRDSTAMQAIGYKEIVRALDGEITMQTAIDDIKQGTRNYAKRQLTWFRRDDRVRWLEADGRTIAQITDKIMEVLK